MVTKISQNGGDLYRCDACNLNYSEAEWANKCEEWCRKNHSCNLDIIEHAVRNK